MCVYLAVCHHDNYCVLFGKILKFLGLLVGKLERVMYIKILVEDLFNLFLYMTQVCLVTNFSTR